MDRLPVCNDGLDDVRPLANDLKQAQRGVAGGADALFSTLHGFL